MSHILPYRLKRSARDWNLTLLHLHIILKTFGQNNKIDSRHREKQPEHFNVFLSLKYSNIASLETVELTLILPGQKSSFHPIGIPRRIKLKAQIVSNCDVDEGQSAEQSLWLPTHWRGEARLLEH